MGEEYAYIIEAFKKILQSRHKVQEALCYMILPRYEDFAKDYKIFKKYKDCRDFEECLALSAPLTKEKILPHKRFCRFILKLFSPLI